MKNQQLQNWAWILIYGGALLFVFSLFLGRDGVRVAWLLTVLGALAAAVGATLIWLRSRRTDDET